MKWFKCTTHIFAAEIFHILSKKYSTYCSYASFLYIVSWVLMISKDVTKAYPCHPCETASVSQY